MCVGVGACMCVCVCVCVCACVSAGVCVCVCACVHVCVCPGLVSCSYFARCAGSHAASGRERGADLCLERLDLVHQDLAHVLNVRHTGVVRGEQRELLLVEHHLPLQLGMPGLKPRPNLDPRTRAKMSFRKNLLLHHRPRCVTHGVTKYQ